MAAQFSNKATREARVKVSPPGPNSLVALSRLHETIGRGNYMGLYGITIERCEDVFLMDVDGNTYLD
jgi:4-aminobutyrate aminotransferase